MTDEEQAIIDTSLAVYAATDRSVYGSDYATRLHAAETAWGIAVRAYLASSAEADHPFMAQPGCNICVCGLPEKVHAASVGVSGE